MAWKLDEAIFVQDENGLSYAVKLYERLEGSNGRVFMDRVGPLTEAQARELGFDLADVLADLDTLALASLDAARDDAAAKADTIADLEGKLTSTIEDRDSLAERLTKALAQATALDADRNRLTAVAAEQADTIANRDAEIVALLARIADLENAKAAVGADEAMPPEPATATA
ncbi:MAG: hypothetical protein ABIV36_12435 [Sphingobium limneticum]